MRTLKFKDNAYRVLHIIREDRIENLSSLKKNMQYDLLLREHGKLWFLENIPEAEIVEVVPKLVKPKRKRKRKSRNER
jgi:hypothetical protein